jgi:hypothetical protein
MGSEISIEILAYWAVVSAWTRRPNAYARSPELEKNDDLNDERGATSQSPLIDQKLPPPGLKT